MGSEQFVVRIEPFVELDSVLAHRLGPDRAAVWGEDRSRYAPQLVRVSAASSDAVVACALVSARRGAAYVKIVDAWCAPSADAAGAPDTEAFAALLDAVVDLAPAGVVVVKFEERPGMAPLWPGAEEVLQSRDFRRDAAPVHSVPSTLGVVRGWSRWARRVPRTHIPYFGQTTEYTCGAAALLMGVESLGAAELRPDDRAFNRSREIELWRTATNMPAIDPVGLAVSLARLRVDRGLPVGVPEVFVSAPDAVLLEDFSGDERDMRRELQAESAHLAEQLGVSVHRRWIDIDEVFVRVHEGALVWLLIDLTVMIADPTPHWVLAHEAMGDCLIVADPWVDHYSGETWVDAHNLPVPREVVGQMARWGDPPYRGAVIVSPVTPDQ